MAALGMASEEFRLPLVNMPDDQREVLLAGLRRWGVL